MNQVEQELICCVCLDLFTTPVILPCSHNLCKNCVRGLSNSSGVTRRIFDCPKCRQEVRISTTEGLDGLPENIALKNIIAIVKKEKLEAEIKEVENVKECLKHRLLLSYYCKTCKSVICETCLKESHLGFGHHVGDVTTVLEEKQDKATSCLSELRQLILRLEEQHKQIVKKKEKINHHERNVQKTIDCEFQHLLLTANMTKMTMTCGAQKLCSENREALKKEEMKCQELLLEACQLVKMFDSCSKNRELERKLQKLEDFIVKESSLTTFKLNNHVFDTPEEDLPVVRLCGMDEAKKAIEKISWAFQGIPGKIYEVVALTDPESSTCVKILPSNDTHPKTQHASTSDKSTTELPISDCVNGISGASCSVDSGSDSSLKGKCLARLRKAQLSTLTSLKTGIMLGNGHQDSLASAHHLTPGGVQNVSLPSTHQESVAVSPTSSIFSFCCRPKHSEQLTRPLSCVTTFSTKDHLSKGMENLTLNQVKSCVKSKHNGHSEPHQAIATGDGLLKIADASNHGSARSSCRKNKSTDKNRSLEPLVNGNRNQNHNYHSKIVCNTDSPLSPTEDPDERGDSVNSVGDQLTTSSPLGNILNHDENSPFRATEYYKSLSDPGSIISTYRNLSNSDSNFVLYSQNTDGSFEAASPDSPPFIARSSRGKLQKSKSAGSSANSSPKPLFTIGVSLSPKSTRRPVKKACRKTLH